MTGAQVSTGKQRYSLFGDGMSFIRLAVAGLALCATATVASAQGGPPPGAPPQGGPGGPQGGPGGRGGRGMAMLLEGITLTDAQKAKVDSIQTYYRAERQKMMPDRQAGGPPDDATRAKMMEMMNKQTTDIRALLAADQQKVFDENVEKRKAMMQQRSR